MKLKQNLWKVLGHRKLKRDDADNITEFKPISENKEALRGNMDVESNNKVLKPTEEVFEAQHEETEAETMQWQNWMMESMGGRLINEWYSAVKCDFFCL